MSGHGYLLAVARGLAGFHNNKQAEVGKCTQFEDKLVG